jgi:hypothetical protein
MLGGMGSLHPRNVVVCGVAVAATVSAGLGVWAVSGVRSEHEAREAAVAGLRARTGLPKLEVARSYVSENCAVVQLHQPAMKHGVTSVALSRVDGRWQVRVIQDDHAGITFDPDDAKGGGCQNILRTGGRRP